MSVEGVFCRLMGRLRAARERSLGRRPRFTRLLNLAEVEQCVQIVRRRPLGLQTVPLREICGSMRRCGDFDARFRLRNPRHRLRWLNVAAELRRGDLVPVDLIKVGDVYFVRDGHHRISVANWLGWEDIPARVTEWLVEGDLPWQKGAR